MAKELSNTWIIIRIGKRKYAINSSHVKAITDVSRSQFITESRGAFVRGVYRVLNMDIPILDGHKIAREEPGDTSKVSFATDMTNLKINYLKWMDSVEWGVLYGDSESADEATEKSLQEWVDTCKIAGDRYLERQVDKLKQYLSVNMEMCSDLVKRRNKKKIGLAESITELDRYKDEGKKVIEATIDNIIDYHNESVVELCVIMSANSREFGMTIDSMELVHESPNKANVNEQRTVLSTGTIEINNVKYNVLGLTKLANLIV